MAPLKVSRAEPASHATRIAQPKAHAPNTICSTQARTSSPRHESRDPRERPIQHAEQTNAGSQHIARSCTKPKPKAAQRERCKHESARKGDKSAGCENRKLFRILHPCRRDRQRGHVCHAFRFAHSGHHELLRLGGRHAAPIPQAAAEAQSRVSPVWHTRQVPKLPLPPGVQRNRHKRVTGVIQNRTGPPAVAMHRRAVAHWRRQQRACAQTRSLRLQLARLPRAAPCRPCRPSPHARRSKRACLTSITPRACAGAARAAGATREAPARAFARNQHLGSLAHISAFGCRVWAPPSGSVWSEVDAQPPHATPQRRPPAAAHLLT